MAVALQAAESSIPSVLIVDGMMLKMQRVMGSVRALPTKRKFICVPTKYGSPLCWPRHLSTFLAVKKLLGLSLVCLILS